MPVSRNDDGWMHYRDLVGVFFPPQVIRFLEFLTLSSSGSLVSHRGTSLVVWGANLKVSLGTVVCEAACHVCVGWSSSPKRLADHPDSDGQCFGLPLMRKGPPI